MRFSDRESAGRLLAARLAALKDANPVVLALPRGGVAVAAPIARALAAPLDLVLVRKIGAPDQPELAIGAIVDGAPPELVMDPARVAALHVGADYIARAQDEALREIERRRAVYAAGRSPVEVAGRTAIVVDDGIATGATVLAALRAVRRRGPARLVLAAPVAPTDAVARLREEADEAVFLDTPANFYAVGQFYEAFPQLTDAEVVALLRDAPAPPKG
ncbi:MAG: phosphoribosyltransferase [Proteobacteria bacterium]|nr:phosphoribosyltransferase [Pseudomonadota bacterium]